MDLFTYLLKKKGHNSSVNGDLFSYLLASRKRGTYQTYTGTQINVVDSINARMKNWILGGNTNQNGTPTPDAPIDIHNVIGENNVIENTGKNLYEPIANNVNLNGLVPTIENDGSISVSGTPTQIWSNVCGEVKTYLEAGTYTFSISKTYTFSCNIRAFTKKEGAEYETLVIGPGQTKVTKTFTSKIYYWRFYIVGLTIGEEIDENFKVQIEVGSTATPFEKYKGKNYKVSLASKNLLNINNCERGYSYNYGAVGTDAIRTTSSSRITLSPEYAIKVKPNTKYTFNMNTTEFDFGVGELQSNKKTNGDSGWANGILTVTTKNNTDYIVFNFRKKNDTLFTPITDEQWQDFLSSEAQLELGEQSTPYVPYLNIELCKIGNYQDKIYKSNDKWLLEKNIGKIILDGSENWFLAQTNTNTLRFGSTSALQNGLATNSIKIICNNFPNGTETTDNSDNEHIRSAVAEYPDYLFINIDKTRVSNLTEFTEWLSAHSTIVYYILETPVTTEITDDNLINQLEQLSKARSFDGQTNITQLSEQLPFDLTVDIKTL
jgi:hypothetical protein